MKNEFREAGVRPQAFPVAEPGVEQIAYSLLSFSLSAFLSEMG